MTEKMTAANVLRKYQKQCDEEGVEVQVSRQALDEVLSELETAKRAYADLLLNSAREVRKLEAEVERLKENRNYWMESCQIAQQHRDGANAQVREFEAKLLAVEGLPEKWLGQINASAFGGIKYAGHWLRRCADELEAMLKEGE